VAHPIVAAPAPKMGTGRRTLLDQASSCRRAVGEERARGSFRGQP